MLKVLLAVPVLAGIAWWVDKGRTDYDRSTAKATAARDAANAANSQTAVQLDQIFAPSRTKTPTRPRIYLPPVEEDTARAPKHRSKRR